MKIATRIVILMLSLLSVFCLVACADVEVTGLWESATYTSNEELGEGAKTVLVEVKAEDQSLTFTIHTDKEMLGDALLELELIAGEEGPYGLYIESVNGMAIGENEKAYWALYKDGAYSMTGVDTTPIADGEHYELVKESY